MTKGRKRKTAYPDKTTMNLYYKPDRTTLPATVALYVLFVLALLMGFGKFFVYDMLLKLEETREQLGRVQQESENCRAMLEDYDEILRRYRMYSATAEEESRTDRMEVLRLLDEKIRPFASISSISMTDGFVNVKFSGVTLRKTAEIVRELDASPLVAGTSVNTAVADEKTAGGQVADKKTADKQTTDKRTADEQAAGRQAADKRTANEPTVDGQTADKKTAGRRAADKKAANEPTADERAADRQNTDKKAVGRKSADKQNSAKRTAGRKRVRNAGRTPGKASVESTGGTLVTAGILISLQKENGEESMEHETETDWP